MEVVDERVRKNLLRCPHLQVITGFFFFNLFKPIHNFKKKLKIWLNSFITICKGFYPFYPFITDTCLTSVSAWPRAISWHYKLACNRKLHGIPRFRGGLSLAKPQQLCHPLLQGGFTHPWASQAGCMCWAYAPSALKLQDSCFPWPIPKLIVAGYKLFALCCSVPSPRAVLAADAEKLFSKASRCSCISQMMSVDSMGRLQQTGYLILWALLDVSRSKLQCLGFISFF